jgi:uncharacterized peroxidase-related enzyme
MTHHGEALRRLTSEEFVAQVKEDYTQADLEPADRALLDYAVKLARSPDAMVEEDVEALRDAGFSERAILDIVQVTAYFSFVVRIADGLGVTVEDWS